MLHSLKELAPRTADSLVSRPIALYPATSEREKISFHQINKTYFTVRRDADGISGYGRKRTSA